MISFLDVRFFVDLILLLVENGFLKFIVRLLYSYDTEMNHFYYKVFDFYINLYSLS